MIGQHCPGLDWVRRHFGHAAKLFKRGHIEFEIIGRPDFGAIFISVSPGEKAHLTPIR
jgi:hypothetical protein